MYEAGIYDNGKRVVLSRHRTAEAADKAAMRYARRYAARDEGLLSDTAWFRDTQNGVLFSFQFRLVISVNIPADLDD